MKNYLLRLSVLCVLLNLFFPSIVSAQNLQNFTFSDFDADYYLTRESDKSSTLTVKETLVAIFPDYDQNHGIARAIPATYEGHDLRLTLTSVTDENNLPLAHTTEKQNDNLIVKIQNPGVYVHGKKTYKINYVVHDATRFFKGHDEFFWDINGDQWAQTFGVVNAHIHVPTNLESALKSRELCYTGYHGSTSQNCAIKTTKLDKEAVVDASASNIGPQQALSVVMAFKPGTFAKSAELIKQERNEKIQLAIGVVLTLLVPLVVFVFMFRRWRKFGNDPKGRGIIIPEYGPPKGFDPLGSDFLLKQKIRNVALSATLIDLAVKGYVTIYEIPKKGIFGNRDYELLLKSPPADASAQTMMALRIIFGEALAPNTRIKLSDFKKSPSLQREMLKEMKDLENFMSDDLYKKGFFVKDPKKVKRGYLVWGFVLMISGYVLAIVVGNLTSYALWGLLFGMGLAGLVMIGFAFIMPARTLAGVQAHDDLLGLKEYIKIAEADRIKFLQSPEGAEKIIDKDAFDPKTKEAKIKLFEKLLPYAMLFGAEKDWAKQFNDLYITPPSWYQGGNWSAFNAGYLAGSLSNFNTAAGASFASPSSSSGSGFSGGGAGGGGGGGGGGGI